MTAYTSANVDFVYLRQEGNFNDYLLHMDRLDTSDTLDLTPWVHTGQKACFVDAEDHASTISNDVEVSGTTTTSTTSRFRTSMVVSTDVVTFTSGGNSTDAHVTFKVVPGR